MPSAAVRDEGALQMRPAPCGYLSARSFGLYRTSCRGGRPCPPVLRPHSFLSLFEKEKNRRGVRRSQLHSVSAGAAKTPYPQPSSSFPNCDRFTGSQFGHLEFYNAARYLDDGGQAIFCEYVFRKSRCFTVPQSKKRPEPKRFRAIDDRGTT